MCCMLQELWRIGMGDYDSGPQSVPGGGEQGTAGTDRGERVKIEQAQTMST